LSNPETRLINYLEDKKILILGFGREGRSSYDFLRRFLPEKPLSVADKNYIELNDKNASVYTGNNYLSAMDSHELILKSPGIPFRDAEIPTCVEITCQTDLFLRFSGKNIIGITGTKGKTTTSTLIYNMLKASGRDACLIGNMGIPVFEGLHPGSPETAVIEMSSHQLEFARSSPHIAVLTNIYEEHLDHYKGGFAGYVNAKLNIMRYQNENDYFIVNGEQDFSLFAGSREIKSKIIPIKEETDDAFLDSLADINTHLLGRHNKQDTFFAAAAARLAGATDEGIFKAVSEYAGIEHRMELFGTFGGADYYNDSIATIPRAVVCAVEALGNVGTLIIGGMDRGLGYGGFIEDLTRLSIPNIVCLPDTGHTIGESLNAKGCASRVIFAADMEGAVKNALKHTPKGSACIMSPAAPSYNKYKDFDEKGKDFKRLVRLLSP